LREHHNKTRPPAESPEMARSFVLAPFEDEDVAEDPATIQTASGAAPVVIAEMSAEVPRLTVGEAVMRMDLADPPVLLFRNRAHGELNVVYRRDDGNIGWIDPAADRKKPEPR